MKGPSSIRYGNSVAKEAMPNSFFKSHYTFWQRGGATPKLLNTFIAVRKKRITSFVTISRCVREICHFETKFEIADVQNGRRGKSYYFTTWRAAKHHKSPILWFGVKPFRTYDARKSTHWLVGAALYLQSTINPSLLEYKTPENETSLWLYCKTATVGSWLC